MKSIKIKFTGFWTDDEHLYHRIVQLAGNTTKWKNLEITKSEDFDYLIVLTRPNDYKKLSQVPFKKVMLFLTEPIVSNNIDHNLITTYNKYHWEYFFIPTWDQISQDQFDQIWDKKNIRKTKLFSSVCSELYSDNPNFSGYFNRLRFLHYFDNRTIDTMEVYGRRYSGRVFDSLSSYKSEIINKYDALIPYQYHFNCENSYLPGYFTEKIVDPILSECLCFYSGCPDITNIISEDSFIQLDLDDPEKSFWTICDAIKRNFYHKKIEAIRRSKKVLLTDLNPINQVWKKINNR